MRLRRFTVLLVALAALLGGAYVAIERVGPERSPDAGLYGIRSDGASAPGVVVICLDTLRADALSLDSGRPVRMPRLEAFARDSVSFADAQSSAAWTIPSVATLLTGFDPARTGVFGLPERTHVLPQAVPTLAQELSRAGWYTAALASSEWLGPASSIMRGFDEGMVGLDRNPEALLEAWNRRRTKGVPFFLFLHSLAAHDPYLRDAIGPGASGGHKQFGAESGRIDADVARSPLSYDDVVRVRSMASLVVAGSTPPFADFAWAFEQYMTSATSRARLMAAIPRTSLGRVLGALRRWLEDDCGRDPGVAALAQRLRAAYDASLADVDHMTGRIFDGIARLRLPEDTIVIVVSDHGESFGEHGTFGHGRRVFDELLRVPMIVHAPRRMGVPRVVHGPCGLVDVVPTILALIERPAASWFDGCSLVDAGAGPLPDRAMNAVDERLWFDAAGEHVVRFEAIRTTRAKCIVSRDPGTRRILGVDLYNLLLDPGEARAFPLGALSHATDFGVAFADALKDRGLAMPRPATTTRPGDDANAGVHGSARPTGSAFFIQPGASK